MPTTLWILLAAALLAAVAALWHRRGELRRQHALVHERAAMQSASARLRPLQVPRIDLERCMGCGTCVRECPEQDVLALVHGQAQVVNPAGCVGHANCVSECPVDAVTLEHADLQGRDDVPVLTEDLQCPDRPGLYLIGEVTGRSLIRTATTHGTAVGRAIPAAPSGEPGELLDAVVVGAGPGGLACALALKAAGRSFVVIDQETVVGGQVARYPRRKLVLTDRVELPLFGRLQKREYEKEELIALWQKLQQQHRLPIRGGVTFDHVETVADHSFVVHTDGEPLRARNVVLAIGRRGRPRRLGVPGEDLPHVSHALLDAASYRECDCVVVGGGDSAAEAALALAEQPGNRVTLVYRGSAFARLRGKNRQRLQQQLAVGALEAWTDTDVVAIEREHVEVQRPDEGGSAAVAVRIRADHVFVMAGGEPPFAALRKSGISFDHPERPPTQGPSDAAGQKRPAHMFAAGIAFAIATLAFLFWYRDYYFGAAGQRAATPEHVLLRPGQNLGLVFGSVATAALLVNLAYLLRRQQLLGVRFARLSTWMRVHVTTGVLAVLLVALHAAFAPRATPAGYAFWGLVGLLGTGAIGRWFYAWLPRTTNGGERQLDDLRTELHQLQQDRGRSPFALAARVETLQLIEARQWRSSWLSRALSLLGHRRDLAQCSRRIAALADQHDVDRETLNSELQRTRTAHRLSIAVSHLEDLRSLLNGWRWLHRWLALLVVLLVLVHVAQVALRNSLFGGGQ